MLSQARFYHLAPYGGSTNYQFATPNNPNMRSFPAGRLRHLWTDYGSYATFTGAVEDVLWNAAAKAWIMANNPNNRYQTGLEYRLTTLYSTCATGSFIGSGSPFYFSVPSAYSIYGDSPLDPFYNCTLQVLVANPQNIIPSAGYWGYGKWVDTNSGGSGTFQIRVSGVHRDTQSGTQYRDESGNYCYKHGSNGIGTKSCSSP